MGHKMSMPDFYYRQRDIAHRYGISDMHSGCHVGQYPNERLCPNCKKLATCKAMYEREKTMEKDSVAR